MNEEIETPTPSEVDASGDARPCCKQCDACPGFSPGNPTTHCRNCDHKFQDHTC